MFEEVARRVRDKRVLYLEFGVFQGESMRYWSHALKNPDAKLHGFDSFEGLPEVYGSVGSRLDKGAFDLGGGIPRFDDPRVQLFKGWFDQVLPNYKPPDHDVLVINMDADLYSSTIFVLRHLKPYIKPGVFIYFDNLSQPEHEPKAFDDFVRETGLEFRALCADKTLMQAFFECLG